MQRFFFVISNVLLVASFSLIVSAQSPDKILKQASKSIGGEKPLKNIKSWQVKGTVTRKSDGESGNYQAVAMVPNLYADTFDLRGLETSVGYNGKSGWARDSRSGLRTITGEASRDFQAEAAFRNSRWLEYKKEKSKLAFAPSTINGKSVNTVVMTTAKNVKIKLHFDPTSGLLLREEIPFGADTKIFDYSDYKTVGGIMEPHAITATIDKEIYEIKLDQIVHNPTLNRAAFDFPKISNEPLPDIPSLLQEVKVNEEEIENLLEKYTFTEKEIQRESDQTGQLREKESRVSELTFYKGYRIRRVIEKNGKPLSPSETESEDKRVEKRVRDIEKREAEKDKKAQEQDGPPDPERSKRVSIADVLRGSKLVNPRRERFRGRPVIVFDFEPLPGYKPQKRQEKFFGKTVGAVWVDAADRQVARLEARLVDSYNVAGGLLASLKEGATFVLEKDRINDEIWLPTRADINLLVKVLMVKGINANTQIEFSNYKRFNVDSEKEKLKDPVKP